jgi:zinc ribbon protein
MNCPRCGSENRPGAIFCSSCAYRLEAEEEAPVGAGVQGMREATTDPATDTAPLSGAPIEPAPSAEVAPADSAPPPTPAPPRRGGLVVVAIVGWVVAIVALAAAGFLAASRSSLSTEAADLRDQVEDQEQIVRARQTDLTRLREQNDELDGKLSVCKKTARTSRQVYELWVDLVSSFTNVSQGERIFTKLLNIDEQWDRANERCLAQ